MFNIVVVGTDGSPTADQAVESAAGIARTLGCASSTWSPPTRRAASGIRGLGCGRGCRTRGHRSRARRRRGIGQGRSSIGRSRRYGSGLEVDHPRGAGRPRRGHPEHGGRGRSRPHRRREQGHAPSHPRQRAELGRPRQRNAPSSSPRPTEAHALGARVRGCAPGPDRSTTLRHETAGRVATQA